jgi:renalase
MDHSLPVVIVGGGITGIMAADKIKENGISVIVLEKNDSLGGRLATNCINGEKADYGAQFFTVRTDQFQKYVDNWGRNGWVDYWFGEPHKRYKSVNGMKKLVENLADGLTVKLKTKVTHIRIVGDRYYKLYTEADEVIEARAVLITAPAPETLDIIKKSKLPIDSNVKNQLRSIQFSPCLAAIVTCSESSFILEPGYLSEGLPEGIERIVDNRKKGISLQTTLTIYADGKWSKKYWDKDDIFILDKLIKKASKWIKHDRIKTKMLKKWRYAESLSVMHQPFLYMKLSVPLFAAGDVFLHKDDAAGRTRVESALLSAVASAEALMECLKNK